MLVAPGTSAGWAELCLGGSLDGLRLGSELLARLGLRPVADTQDTPAGGLRDWA